MEYKYTSIVLGKRDVGETDRIYSLYTLEEGKTQVLAKGVRKSQAKLAGLLENFTLADVSVAKGRGMGKITGVVVENSFASLRTEYSSISKTLSSINTFQKLVDLGHKDPAIFKLLQEYLEAMDSLSLIASTLSSDDFEDKTGLIGAVYFLKLLHLLGYGIETGFCAECGKKTSRSETGEYFFSAKSGGLVCSDCMRINNAQLRLGENAIKLINLSSKNGLKSFLKVRASRKDIALLEISIRELLAWT